MTRKNFYVLVDKDIEMVINHPSELPENWNNINGLPGLSDEELEDLEWTGHSNFSWIKFDSKFPDSYKFADSWEFFAKETMKSTYSKQRWNAESKGIVYKGVNIGTDDRTKTAFLIKKQLMSKSSSETFSWKSNNSIAEFGIKDVTNILSSINDYVQKCFEVEVSLIKELDLIEKPSDLMKFTLDIEWPSDIYN